MNPICAGSRLGPPPGGEPRAGAQRRAAGADARLCNAVPPLLLSELELNTKCVVEMEGNQTVLHPPPSNTKQGER